MNLKVPGAILSPGCAILSTRAITVRGGLVQPPLGELGLMRKPGGPLECQGGYQARPKIHVIRVVFQDQALYVRTSFRGAKTCKIGKKRCVFGHIDKFGENMTGKLRKMHAKTHI